MESTTGNYEPQLERIRRSPRDKGTLRMIVIRPKTNERVVLDSCHLSLAKGAEGDNWADGCWKTLDDGSPHPDVQLAIMNVRVIEALEPSSDRWPLAGDNLFVDYCLEPDHLQPGDRLSIGEAILEITEVPHNGCAKFSQRFGVEGLKWVNSKEGKAMRLRGIYARVAQDGVVRVGDSIQKMAGTASP